MKGGYPKAILWLVALLPLYACHKDKNYDRFTVIERANSDDSFVPWVPVVLQHDGHKYYARCNNFKGTRDPKVTLRCNLHVGMTVECQFYANRDGSGYDLICENMRNEKGDLDTFGENEMLDIDKEVN